MMSDLKKCLKLCKYGYQFKTNIITGLFFLILGLLFLFLSSGFNVCLAAAYLLLGPSILVQVTYCMLFSDLLASSSLHRVVDGAFPNIVGIIASLFAFGMIYAGLLVNPKLRTGSLGDSGNIVIGAGLVIAVVIIFCGVSFKFFVTGTAVFTLMFIGAMAGCGILTEGPKTTDLLTGSIIGFLIVVAGNVLSCILRMAVYKCALSPHAGGNSLRKAMK